MRGSSFVIVACLSLSACEACEEEAPRAVVVPDAAEPPAPAPPPREGCSRVGSVEALLRDPSCVLSRVNDDVMRASMKHLSITVATDPEEVFGGNTALLNVTIKNTSSTETLVVLEARTRMPGPRPDWSRVLGVPEPRATTDTLKLFFPVTTTDHRNRDVDALPVVPGSAADPPPPTPIGVRLRPGGKLVHTTSWWALRIPAPPPIVQDDAGHRYVPKTTALPLEPGEYNVIVELPLWGLGREERKASTRVRVVRVPKLDGGPS